MFFKYDILTYTRLTHDYHIVYPMDFQEKRPMKTPPELCFRRGSDRLSASGKAEALVLQS